MPHRLSPMYGSVGAPAEDWVAWPHSSPDTLIKDQGVDLPKLLGLPDFGFRTLASLT